MPFLKEKWRALCQGNLYTTTIHAVNSCILKASKLLVACPVYRGFTRARLPAEFWTANEFGVAGGVEFGFTSTTFERAQAEHYAAGTASTVLEMQLGMVDRGASLEWLSQCVH